MKKVYIIGAILLACLLGGLFIPLKTYTTTKWACGVPTETKRLRVILGESLDEIIKNDETKEDELSPFVGCAVPIKYTLYLL